MFSQRILKSAVVILLAACTAFAQTAAKTPAAKMSGKPSATHKSVATVAEAQTFMKKAEEQLLDLGDLGVGDFEAVLERVATAVQGALQTDSVVGMTSHLLAPAVSFVHDRHQFLDRERGL